MSGHDPRGTSEKGLVAEFEVARGSFALDLDMTVEPGEVVALLGPNGAGKSTALRVLAGLLRPTRGRLVLEGRALDDAAADVHVPPEKRGVGVVFQDYRLFPHLSALDNVAFGLRCRGVSKAEARAKAAAWLERVGLAGLAAARPGSMSGGQAQRVALARALAPEPRLLLLDEPLAALDARTRLDVRSDLRRHLEAFTGATVVVSHDPVDAMVLADEVLVLEGGRVVQRGPIAEVARRPKTDYVARLVGLNLYRGHAIGSTVKVGDGVEIITAEPAEGPVFVAFSPTCVAVFRERPDGSPRNVWPAQIETVELSGSGVRLRLDGPLPLLADVTAAAASDLDLVPGREVWAAVKASDTHAYPA
jgi:molybdate transport system ATP-binding protein